MSIVQYLCPEGGVHNTIHFKTRMSRVDLHPGFSFLKHLDGYLFLFVRFSMFWCLVLSVLAPSFSQLICIFLETMLLISSILINLRDLVKFRGVILTFCCCLFSWSNLFHSWHQLGELRLCFNFVSYTLVDLPILWAWFFLCLFQYISILSLLIEVLKLYFWQI